MAKPRSWNDDELRAAVSSSTSYKGVVRSLGLKPGGGTHYDIKNRIEELALDISHFTNGGGHTVHRWRDDELCAAVAKAKSLGEVLQYLGLPRTNAADSKVRRRIRILRIDTSHFTRTSARVGRQTTWTTDQLRVAVADSRSVAQVLIKLHLVPAGGNYNQVQRRIRELGINTKHFTGAGWRRGATTPIRPAAPLDTVLVAGRWIGSHSLKKRLFRAGLKGPQCELCGWAVPRSDGVIPVELDHINGDKNDNRLENLRVLCPNCHALQPTHRALNRRRLRNKS